jgi:small-conductance mechanosensitive channel
MANLNQQLESKTNRVMVISSAILVVLPAFGIDFGTEGTATIMGAIGVIMRQVTKEPLSDK